LTPFTKCYTLDKKRFTDECAVAAANPDEECSKKIQVNSRKKKKVSNVCKSSCNLRCLCQDTTLKIKIKDKRKFKKCKRIPRRKCNDSASLGIGKKMKKVYEFCPVRCNACLLE